MTDLDLVGLREIAEAASMGRWRVVVDDARNEVRVDAAGARIAWTGGVDEEWAELDAEHIAAFDPPMVLALIDRIEELEVLLGPVVTAFAVAEESRVKFTDAYSEAVERAAAARRILAEKLKELDDE